MAKQPKWVASTKETLTEHSRAVFEPGPVLDRAFWLPWDASLERWIESIEAVDKKGDKTRLLELLRSSNHKLSHDARVYLADLLERHELKKPRGAQPTPAYDRTDAEALLEMQKICVPELRKLGMTVEEALAHLRRIHRIPFKILKRAYRGERTSTRRMKKRRP